MTNIETLDKILEEIILDELNKLSRGTKIRTLDFVNTVINRLKEKVGDISEELEVNIRSRIVDILWDLQRRKVVKFEETLIRFEKL